MDDRKEWAWAAGFFDSVGRVTVNEGERGVVKSLSCSHEDRAVVMRFWQATDNRGTMTQYVEKDKRKPRFSWCCRKRSDVELIAGELAKYASAAKKELLEMLIEASGPQYVEDQEEVAVRPVHYTVLNGPTFKKNVPLDLSAIRVEVRPKQPVEKKPGALDLSSVRVEVKPRET